jgi:alkanesulfonate monooxygenase SsuD/methylene tetrahydromethanopterin reductase-like flavin-dependent oxidoreductase (luciferase family)
VLQLTRHLDDAGWDGVYLPDHFMPHDPDGEPRDGPMLEAWTSLSALAAATSNVRLGTLVLGSTYRHPALVANMAGTLSEVTGGRFVLGVGAGWQPNEHTAYGIELLAPSLRLDQFAEACAVIRGLLREPRVTVTGAYYRVTDAPCEPKGAAGPVPLLVGGGGERRTLRVAAEHADEWHAWGTPEEFRHKCAVLDRHCQDVGRDPSDVRRATGESVDGLPESELRALVRAYQSAGADEFIVRDSATTPIAAAMDATASFMQTAAVG